MNNTDIMVLGFLVFLGVGGLYAYGYVSIPQISICSHLTPMACSLNRFRFICNEYSSYTCRKSLYLVSKT